jgi:hypothetical protein
MEVHRIKGEEVHFKEQYGRRLHFAEIQQGIPETETISFDMKLWLELETWCSYCGYMVHLECLQCPVFSNFA